MFWSTTTFADAGTQQIDSVLLDVDTLTLEKLLDVTVLLEQCRQGHRRLLEYLQSPEQLHAMLDYITVEPSKDIPVSSQYKYANIVCEVLTSEISFAEKIVAGVEYEYLHKLFNFFKQKTELPLNPLLASYVCRVLNDVITRKHDQNWYSYKVNTIRVLGYIIESDTDVIELLLTHLGTTSVCDFVYKLTMDIKEQDTRNNLLEWFNKADFVQRLMSRMGMRDAEVHEGVDRLVNDYLDAFREALSPSLDRASNADPLFLALTSPKTMEVLLSAMFDHSVVCESSIKYGLNIVAALMGIPKKQQQSVVQKSWAPIYCSPQDITVDPEVHKLVASRFSSLYNILCTEPKGKIMILTYGEAQFRVGTMRLSIAKFFAQVSSLRDPTFIEEMIDNGVLRYLIFMFWQNQWNGFLHRDIERILLNILLMPSRNAGIKFILHNLDFLYNVMEVFKKPKSECGVRGHLARFAYAYRDVISREGYQKDIITELQQSRQPFFDEWNKFLSDVIEPYLQRERVRLGGATAPRSSAALSSLTVTSEVEQFSDISNWEVQGDLRVSDATSDAFGVFNDSDGGKDMFWAAKENGLDESNGSEGAIGGTPYQHGFDENEWQNSETLLKELSGLYT